MLNRTMATLDRVSARWPWIKNAVLVLMLLILARQLSKPFFLPDPTAKDWAVFALFAGLGSAYLLLEYFFRVISPRMDRKRRESPAE